MSQTILCRNFGGKKGGGRTFEGGVIAGHYGTEGLGTRLCEIIISHV